MVFLDLPIILPQIKAGGLRAIAIGAPERAPTATDVPTTAEVGMPDLLIENWYGMVGARRHAGGDRRRAEPRSRPRRCAIPSSRKSSPFRAPR